MTIEELREYYETGYAFNKETGMAANSFDTWCRQGFIPVHSQLKVEKASSGELVARIEDGETV